MFWMWTAGATRYHDNNKLESGMYMKANTLPRILSVVIALCLCACGTTDAPVVIEPTEDAQLAQLLERIEAGVKQYDGHTVSHDAGTITVRVWSESITNLADSVLAQGSGPEDEAWVQARADVEATVVHVADCIRTSDFASTKLLLSVLDHADQSRKLLTFDNSGVAYDIVAETPVAPPTEPSAEPEPPAPASPSTPEASTTPNQSGGGANNFNTHNSPEQQQTSASFVLNTSTQKFHRPTCNDVERIAPENYSPSNESRSALLGLGYTPCGHCNP